MQLADLHITAKSLGGDLGKHLALSTVGRLERLAPVAPSATAAAALAAASGTLADLPGESAAERSARIQKAAQGATDISGLVKSRKSQKPAAVANEAPGKANGSGVNGKRKLEDDEDAMSEKKVRFGE